MTLEKIEKGVDFIKIPSVVKLYNGEYTSMNSHVDIHGTLQLREQMIYHTAKSFNPHIFIVDKEPCADDG